MPYSRTKRHQSFLNYALAHFQNSKWISVFYSSFYVVNCLLCNVYFISCVLHCIICRILFNYRSAMFYQSIFLAATIINVCLTLILLMSCEICFIQSISERKLFLQVFLHCNRFCAHLFVTPRRGWRARGFFYCS